MIYYRDIVKNNEKGFTLLLAALVASIVLTIGAAIYHIASKQIVLSSLGKDSQYAFYTADTAAECALYWDIRYGYFSTDTVATSGINPMCNEQPFTFHDPTTPFTSGTVYSSDGRALPKIDWKYSVSHLNKYCANVDVTKVYYGVEGGASTTIHADGFSTDCSNAATAPRTLERSVELHY